MPLNKFGFKITKPCLVRKGKKAAQLITAGNQKAKVHTTIGFKAHDRPDTVRLPPAGPLQLSARRPNEGSRDAPIVISDEETDDTLPSSTPIIARDNGRIRDIPAVSSHTTNLAESGAISAEAQADEGLSYPTIASTLPGKQCLIKIRHYRKFREGLFRLVAITNPDTRHMTFLEGLNGINRYLPAEQRFSALEAKRALKLMDEKLFDSLCVDRVVDLDLRDVELYS